jgi:hypothetical protein
MRLTQKAEATSRICDVLRLVQLLLRLAQGTMLQPNFWFRFKGISNNHFDIIPVETNLYKYYYSTTDWCTWQDPVTYQTISEDERKSENSLITSRVCFYVSLLLSLIVSLYRFGTSIDLLSVCCCWDYADQVFDKTLEYYFCWENFKIKHLLVDVSPKLYFL